MSKYTEEELNRTLADTSQLLGDTPVSEEFSLDDILAEFGTGASARPAAGEPEKAQPEQSPDSRSFRSDGFPAVFRETVQYTPRAAV